MLDALLITRMQDEMTAALHETEGELAIETGADGLMAIAMAQHRASATESHRLRNAERLALLVEQREDLAGCLDSLWAEVLKGTRRFKLYRQMKMYNDPELNPAVYSQKVAAVET